jgi:hypothetical protein
VRRLLVLLSGFAVVACLFSASAIAHKHQRLKHVTIFGDSVAAVLEWDPPALAKVKQGNRVKLELQGCGRLATPGCFSPPPPSVLKEVRTLGKKIGPTVVVLVGYNDDPQIYKKGIDKVLHAMRNNGVKQALWLTLRIQPHPSQYRATNTVIRGAAHRWKFMTVVNWGGYSKSHPEWFGSDGIHFTAAGGVKFGTYLHRTLKRYGLTGPINSTAG